MQSVTSKNQENENPVEINQHDKFFTRIMSKDTSVFNSSTRVYYGGASGSVPFMWESRPGTPKHTLFSDTSNIPPLTPPPSYFSSKSMHKNMKPNYNYLLSNIFPRLRKKNHVTPSSSLSSTTTTTSSIYSSSSSSSSSLSSFYSPPVSSKAPRRRFLSCSTPLHFSFDEDRDNNDGNNSDNQKNRRCRMSIGSNMCYSIVKRKAVQGRYLMKNMKNKFLSMVGHGGSS